MVFTTDSSVKSTKQSNLRAAYYFKVFVLDEREVHSYNTSVPSPRALD